MLYCNTKFKVHSLDGDIDLFVIVGGTLQGSTLAPHLFIICLDYVLRTLIYLMKENGFTLIKTITDADNAEDIDLLANTTTQAKSLLRSREQAEGSKHWSKCECR